MQAGETAQERGVAAVVRCVLQELGDRVEVGFAGLQRGGDERGVLIVGVQPRGQRVLGLADGLALVVVLEPRAAELGGQLVDVGEAEHRRQRLVERGQRVEHRRQLGVGEERAEARQVALPAMLGERGGRGRAARRVVERHAVRPLLLERHGRARALQHELGRDPRRAFVVQALPRLRPRLRSLLPPLQAAGHQQLQALGERGLAAAVAADDDGQARARLERQRRRRADPAEALDGHRAQPHGRGRPVARRFTGVAGDLDHAPGLGLQLAGREAFEQERAENGVHG